MADLCVKILNDDVNSFVNKDLKLANSVISMDDKIENNFNLVKEQLIDIISNDKNDREYVIDILMCAKYFKKIGDHCANIAKWTVFYLTGKHIWLIYIDFTFVCNKDNNCFVTLNCKRGIVG